MWPIWIKASPGPGRSRAGPASSWPPQPPGSGEDDPPRHLGGPSPGRLRPGAGPLSGAGVVGGRDPSHGLCRPRRGAGGAGPGGSLRLYRARRPHRRGHLALPGSPGGAGGGGGPRLSSAGRTAWWPTGSTWGTGSSSSRGRWWGPTDLATPPTERERTTKSPIWAPWWWRMMWRSAPTVPLTGGPWGRRSSGGGQRSTTWSTWPTTSRSGKTACWLPRWGWRGAPGWVEG